MAEIARYKGSRLVYTNDPQEPLAMSTMRINCRPFTYNYYLKTISEPESNGYKCDKIEPVKKFANNTQLLEFVNIVCLLFDPNNEAVYERKMMSTETIMDVVKRYMPHDRQKIAHAFAQ